MTYLNKISPAAAICFQLCDTFYRSKLNHISLSIVGDERVESSKARLSLALSSRNTSDQFDKGKQKLNEKRDHG